MRQFSVVAITLLVAAGCSSEGGKRADAGPGACVPVTCESQHKNCGPIPNGCDTGYIECGDCAWPNTCGGSRIPNVCGCDPLDPDTGELCCPRETDQQICAAAGKNCGSIQITDRCTARTRDVKCGTCALPNSCGGGGTANVCGCTPRSNVEICDSYGAECGDLTLVECGRPNYVVPCGGCNHQKTCGAGGKANVCACAETDEQICARLGAQCGTVYTSDICGDARVAACGSCGPGSICGASGLAHRCAAPICSAGGLCWSNPLPQGNPLRDLWAANANDAWAVGDAGTLLHWDGAGWHEIPAGEDDWLGVWGSAANDVWVVGKRGARAHWDGSAWSPQPGSSEYSLNAISGTASDDVWVAAFRTTPRAVQFLHWDGTLWTAYDSPAVFEPAGMFALSSSRVWALGATPFGTVPVLLTWDGTNWSSLSLPTAGGGAVPASAVLRTAWASSANDLWVGGTSSSFGRSNGVLAHFDGTDWQAAASPFASAPIMRLSGNSASDLWASGGEGVVLHFDGTAWTPLESTTAETFTAIHALAGGAAIAGGDNGTLLTIRGGVLDSLTAERPAHLRALWGPDPYGGAAKHLWAVGDRGTALYFNGSTWIPTDTGTNANLNAIWGDSEDPVWAVGDHGTIIHSDHTQWRKARLIPTAAHLRGVWGSSATEVWAVGDHGTILLWNGRNWTLVDSGTTEDLYATWVQQGQTEAWAVGASGRILHFVRGWQPVTSPVQVTLRGIWGRAANDIWAVGDAATVLHWDGTAWSVVQSFPMGTGYLSTTVNFRSVSGSTRVNPDKLNLWVTGDYGTVLRFDGQIWNDKSLWNFIDPSTATTKQTIYSAWGSLESLVAVGANHSILIQTNTASWSLKSPTDTATYLSAVWATSDAVWATDSNGVIRTNRGIDWQPVFSPSLDPLNGLWGFGPHDLWAVGNSPTSTLHWDGTNWSLASAPAKRPAFEAMWASAPDDVWAVSSTNASKIHHWNGQEWTTKANPVGTLVALWGSSAADVWAVGGVLASSVAHWDGTGTDQDPTPVWKAVALPEPTAPAKYPTLHAVRGTGPGDVWAVGNGGRMFHWQGQAWTEEPSPTELDLFALCGAGDSLWAVGGADFSAVVLRLANGTWTEVPSGAAPTLKSCSVGPDGALWVAGKQGIILRRDP